MDTTSAVAGRLCRWLGELMPAGERVDRLVGELNERFAGRREPVDAAACREIEAAAWPWSRHLSVEFDPDGAAEVDTESRGWPPADPDEVRSRAAAVSAVRRLPAGECLIKLDGLEPVGLAQPYLNAAFALARGASGVVLDLRANGGGDPATVALIAGWVLGGEATELSEVVYRDSRRQWWTPDLPAGGALPPAVPVAVLVGASTFSSAEALTYHLRVRGRVSVVGERTRGGADHVTPIQLGAKVRALVPYGYVVDAVTGANWEGGGVAPDIVCAADAALERAVAHLRSSRG